MTEADYSSFKTGLENLYNAAMERLKAASSHTEVEEVRVQYLGRSQGQFKDYSAQIGRLAPSVRGEGGALFNHWRELLQRDLDAKAQQFAKALTSVSIADPTMPARAPWKGALHPVTKVVDEICDVFRELGFTIALGPESESEWYNFTGLNFPADHPAMELHDTLYLQDGGLLRTHTSPVQLRTLQRFAPPLRVLAPGNVYRRDFFDATHAPMFMQLEGLAVDEGISFADLKATLSHFARRIYGKTRRTRFGPSYFPFTEPSAQMDVEVDLGDGRGPRWIEIMGCGLVHPAVLESAGVDSNRYTGWAFGMGPARIAMSRYGVPDLRHLYEGDVRFLEQFA